MSKNQIMTWGAVGFAAFAAWYALKRPKSGTSGTGIVAYDIAKQQRIEVGAAMSQNTDLLDNAFDLKDLKW